MPVFSTGLVFISYSRKDQDVMRRIVRFLREQGINVWLDNEKLIPGTPIWEEEIEKAIEAASAVIVVMSPDSKNSEWVRREISLADQNRKQIFPVLVRGDEDSSITLRLITRQYVDMRENEAAGLDSLCTALISYLNDVATQSPEEPPFAEATTNRNADNISPEPEVVKEPVNGDIILISLAWALAGAIGGVSYNATANPLVGGAVGGAVGGLATAFAFSRKITGLGSKRLLWLALAWLIGVAVGWTIGEVLTEAIGIAFGYAVGIAISVAVIVFLAQIVLNWKNIAWIILAWSLGAALGWWIAKRLLIDQLSLDLEIGWAIGTAIGWAIGGSVTSWQIMKRE